MEREPRVGECVVVVRNGGQHNRRIGERIVVCHVDTSDSTLKGFPGGSAEATNWIPWDDVEPVRFGWEYVQAHLPPDLVAVLSGCEGAETVGLNRHVKLAILASLPDLKSRIEDAVQSLDAGGSSAV